MAEASPAELGARWPELLGELRAARSVVVSSHVNPDGDALGSVLAFSMALDQLGVEHQVLMHHGAPKTLEFLPGIDRVERVSRWESPDLGVILDLEATARLGESLVGVFESAKRTVVIDHHLPHEAPGDVRIVSVKSPATAAILCDLFMAATEVVVTPDMATCLLAGIVTDTGSFRFPNTTAHSMHVAAYLLEAGADLEAIIENVYMMRTMPSVKLLGRFLADLKTECGGRLAWSTVSLGQFAECGATDEDTEGFVNELLAIEGVEVAAILREKAPGVVRGSLRSRGEVDVAAAARPFGGGGHRNAAGVSFDGDLALAEATLVEALKQCLGSC